MGPSLLGSWILSHEVSHGEEYEGAERWGGVGWTLGLQFTQVMCRRLSSPFSTPIWLASNLKAGRLDGTGRKYFFVDNYVSPVELPIQRNKEGRILWWVAMLASILIKVPLTVLMVVVMGATRDFTFLIWTFLWQLDKSLPLQMVSARTCPYISGQIRFLHLTLC